MVLRKVSDIQRPIQGFVLDKNNVNIRVQILDYYRCLDILDLEDVDDDMMEMSDVQCPERQKELSYTQNMLIRAYGVLESGHSITVNLRGFKPFFYIKIPENWERSQCNVFISKLKELVYFKYKDHLKSNQIVYRKPFKEFTGKDKFKYLKLCFQNKESYDEYMYKLCKKIQIKGLNNNQPYKYELYESNIDPIIKFIHLRKINASGWVNIVKYKYQIQKERSTHTNFEINVDWNSVEGIEKIENGAINVAAFDIESDSSHGDFPMAIKNYQKLSQDLITMFNEQGIQTKRTKMHRLFGKCGKKVLETLLGLAFDDNYNNNGIHQIITLNDLKPHPQTVEQIAYIIEGLFEQCLSRMITNDDFLWQLTDLFEYNFPLINTNESDNSHYGLLSTEIMMQLFYLNKNKNKWFKEHGFDVIKSMINLAFNPYFDGFQINRVYTKYNEKPDKTILEAIVPDVHKILNECAEFVHFKKIPDSYLFRTSDGTIYNKENICQDAFVLQLTDLFDKYLPSIEGDKLIQIGTTFQISGQSDCYLKHIICLNSCDNITNDELISDENKDVYLPANDLAKDLVLYEKQLGYYEYLDEDGIQNKINERLQEIKTWDIDYRKKQCKLAAEYRKIKQKETDEAKVIVEFFDNERDVLMAWRELIITNDPDVIVGYNIFNFDFKFLYDRSTELNCKEEFCQLGRIQNLTETLYVQKLSSNGMGDNNLKYIPMNGRVIIDLYKLIQKDYRLDSYKLDTVCHKFLYKEKVDISPKEIFILQKGNSSDRQKIAKYCLIDCILCNRLVCKLEVLSNNIAMSNVCKVPFSYLFLRGQGVKILSLVADVCEKEGYLIPVLPKIDNMTDDSYEGAIVLKPFIGIYFSPIAVADFNSLYPSSMISENISHDAYVVIGGKYDNLPGYDYVDIEYDMHKWVVIPGTKKKIKKKTGVKICRYVQFADGKKSILPSILMNLLSARKEAKHQMEEEKDPFKAKIWNGLQLAYKITANSLYGQCGAKTSAISKTEIAASTTAIGRKMIMFSKNHVEKYYKDATITLDISISGIWNKSSKKLEATKYTDMIVNVKDSYCIYGDTDSIFIKFNIYNQNGESITGLDSIFISMALCKKAAKEISLQLKKPQNLEFEKIICPCILFSRKRYHGWYYPRMCEDFHYENSMGIAVKRRDNAKIVKKIFGGALDIIMKDHDVQKAADFVKNQCVELLNGQFPLDDFIISKTLKSYYKKPNQIAHNVLANRQAQRDPGNRFEPNDRVPYAFIYHPSPCKNHLQGDLIETPDYIKQNNLQINYEMYIKNQIMKPVSQIFALVPGFERIEKMFLDIIEEHKNVKSGAVKLDFFFQKKKTQNHFLKISDLMEEIRISKEKLQTQIVEDDSDTDSNQSKHFHTNNSFDNDFEQDIEDDFYLSNYDDPNF